MKHLASSPARYLHLFMRMLEQRDIDCTPALSLLGVDRASLAHPVAKVPTLPAIEVFQRLVDQHGGPALGLEAGRLVTWGELGDMGRAMLSCDTFGDAMCLAQTFYPLIAPTFRLDVARQPQAMTLTWRPVRAVPYDFVLFCFDMALGTMDAMLERMLGDAAPFCDAHLTRARPAHAAAYRSLRRVRCHFGEPGVPSLRLSLPPDLWDHPMAMRNPDELAMLRERLQHRAQPVAMDGMAQWVAMMLREATGEQPSQVFLAQVAGMSTSSLARRLAAEGTTFRAIANRTRHELARQWLKGGELTVSDVGSRLGYADTPSFVRAFKAAEGITPGRFAKP